MSHEGLNRNPYFYACPISATSRATPDTVLIAAGFVMKGKEGALYLVIPAHLASDRADLDDDMTSWLPEIRVRPSPDYTLRLPLFDDADPDRPLFNYRRGAHGFIDALSIRIPDTLLELFSTVNAADPSRARADATGEDVWFYGFPHIFERWPGPIALPRGGKIESKFRCHAQRDVCGGFSGSALFAGNGDLVGMIVGGGERPAFIPGDIIAAVVNDEPMPREIPVFVQDGKIKIGAD